MLVQFSTENFLSFKEPATLSMLASKRKSKDKALDDGATFDAAPDLKLLKCAAIYGANGSGKSNLFAALKFMKRFVIESSKESQAEDAIKVKPFRLDVESEGRPSKFEIIFVADSYVYQYEFSVDEIEVKEEKLIRKGVRASRETVLFSRAGSEIKIDQKRFSEGDGLQRKTRKNALFLSVCANFDGEISANVIRWFRRLRIVSGLTDFGFLEYTAQRLKDSDWQVKIQTLLKDFDLGIDGLESGTEERRTIALEAGASAEMRELVAAMNKIKIDPIHKISSMHKRFDENGQVLNRVPFDLMRDESEGTKKLVAMSAPLIETLESSYILAIDEFDARLHPVITRNIIRLFNSDGINSTNAQLLVATHDTNLLDRDLLRRDQVWFVERDFFGASHLTSLVEYRIRNDASYEKDYIAGKFGAIPIVGDVRRVFDVSQVRNNDIGYEV
ncbi:AAA family ATPase [Burkholderia cenocepacia]|uniref:AAA family ATPase n=1 Tax=Burkholderia cenocepacia TaxID=95486 RepID=UPI0028BC925C|nr:ATP-binding protein [Burkholderia cenocepacia]MDT6993831.1 ATP-binding protein [Burkholderia cenocepacia]